MPDTQATIGYGITFEFADVATPTDFDYISEIYNITLPSDTTDQIDASHMQSPNRTREYIEGFTDPGSMGFEQNYVAGSATDLLLMAAKGKRKWNRITFPNGVQMLFFGSRESYERAAPHDDKQSATVSFKVSGEPLMTPPTAPRAIGAPGIDGISPPKVGVPLMADPGIWAGAKDFAIQWENDGGTGTWVDIVGATGMAYVPVADDVGDDLRFTITGSNGSFSTAVSSTETAAVIAA